MIGLNLDLSGILDLAKELKPKFDKAAAEAARDLALQVHGHILEEVKAKLHSTREKYEKALKVEPVGDDTWVISLDKSAVWIEDGMEEHEMIDDLLKSNKTKTAKDGSRYLAVPFQHNKGPTQQTQAQNDLTSTLREELKKRNIPYGKIETGADGSPRLGRLHSFDIMGAPLKTQNGPGMGKGPVGQVRQGPTGIPFLQNVQVYQHQIQDQQGKTKTVRQIMTFRTVSSKHKGSGRWVHPGLEAKHFFEEAERWAMDQWEQKIVPGIVMKLSRSL